MNHRLVAIALLAIAVLAAACSKTSSQTSTTTAESPAANAAPSLTPQAVPTLAINLTPPTGWSPQAPAAGVVGQWTEPSNRVPVQNISLASVATAQALPEFVTSTQAQEQKGLTDVTDESAQDVFICNGHPARLVRWAGTRGTQPFEFVQLYAIFDATGVVATYMRGASQDEAPEAVVALQTACPAP